MSDSEPVDPRVELEKRFHSQCEHEWKDYKGCEERLKKQTDTGKNCAGWYNEYWKCIDTKVNTT
jgi:hypothetical protein